MDVILKTLEESFILTDDNTMLTGVDAYKISQMCFFLGKQMKKQVNHAKDQIS